MAVPFDADLCMLVLLPFNGYVHVHIGNELCTCKFLPQIFECKRQHNRKLLALRDRKIKVVEQVSPHQYLW